MTPRLRNWILASAGLVTVGVVVAGVIVLLPSDRDTPAPAGQASAASPPAPVLSAAEVTTKFLTAMAAGDVRHAGELTDDPAAYGTKLTEVWRGLAPTSATAKADQQADPALDAATVEVPFTMTWKFDKSRSWTYPSTLPLAKTGGNWLVHWTPALVHPRLTAERGLVLRDEGDATAVLDRDGNALLNWQGSAAKPVDPSVAPLLTPGMARTAGQSAVKGGSWHVALVDPAGAEVEVLQKSESGAAGKPITSTVSVPTQKAAQAAVDSVGKPAMLVAIQPSTGEILAVAQNAAAGADPNALHGLYAPGSTFKIATSVAALEAGAADINTVLPCPGRQTIGTRTIANAGFELGDVPMHTAFARSCNTTYGKLAADLPADALPNAAGELGLGADFDIPGFTTEAGAVRPAESVPQRVENGIGQGTVQVSPFGLALMSATVASGKAVTPRLWRDLDTRVNAGYHPPPGAVLAKLRTMMREVVTGGTGHDLAGFGAVFGKTGTGQFGDGVHANGAFTGYRGDVAFAVFIENAETSATAVTASGKFLAALR